MNLVESLSLAAAESVPGGCSFPGGFIEEVFSISNSSQQKTGLLGSRGNVQDEAFLHVEHNPRYLIFSGIASSLHSTS
jgi:hypothetical protein